MIPLGSGPARPQKRERDGAATKSLSKFYLFGRAAAEVGLAHAIIVAQCRTGAACDDRSRLQHVTAARSLKCIARVLLDQEHASAGGIDRLDRAEMSCTTTGARPSEGSSRQMRCGSDIMARPSASICCSPPDRVPAFWLCRSRNRANMSNTFSKRTRTFAPSLRYLKAPSSRFSRTVRNGKTRRPSGTSEIPSSVRLYGGRRVISCPRKWIAPARGKSAPATARSVLDLPAPLAPISVTISPSAT